MDHFQSYIALSILAIALSCKLIMLIGLKRLTFYLQTEVFSEEYTKKCEACFVVVSHGTKQNGCFKEAGTLKTILQSCHVKAVGAINTMYYHYKQVTYLLIQLE